MLVLVGGRWWYQHGLHMRPWSGEELPERGRLRWLMKRIGWLSTTMT